MDSFALPESRIVEDIDYVFVQAEEMDIDDFSYDDCDEAIIPSQSLSSEQLCPSISFQKDCSSMLPATGTSTDIESSASIISLEDPNEKMDETLSLEGSITLFSDENLPSLDEVEVQVESPEETTDADAKKIVSAEDTAMANTDDNKGEDLPTGCSIASQEQTTSTKKTEPSPIIQKESSTTNLQSSGSRLSNKKRRKQMKKQKKAIAAANAAMALAEMRSKSTEVTPQKTTNSNNSNSKQSTIKSKKTGDASQIAVACVTESLMAYRKQHKLKKKPENSINYVALL